MSKFINLAFLFHCLCISLCSVHGVPIGDGSTRGSFAQFIKRIMDRDQRKAGEPVMVLAGQPGDGPNRLRNLVPSKRGGDDDFKTTPKSCEASEWFALVAGIPACVEPLWHIGYDPTFCTKMKNGWVYCGCDDDKTPGMAEGIDTCVNRVKARKGRCGLAPCPSQYTCVDTNPGVRFDCVKGDIVVPSYYGLE